MKLEITQRQYEILKANPEPGMTVVEELRYFAESVESVEPERLDTTGVVTGPYKAVGIRRARTAVIVPLDLGIVPKSVPEEVLHCVRSMLTQTGDYTGTQLAKSLGKRFDVHTSEASRWITAMIESRMLGFIA
jgi:hypothetical protein